MRLRVIVCPLALFGAGLALGSPPGAADEGGLLVELEWWQARAQDDEIDYASFAPSGATERVEHEDLLLPRFYAGWRFPAARSELGLRLWEYDDNATDATVPGAPDQLVALLASPSLVFEPVDAADARDERRATVADLDYRFTQALGRSTRLVLRGGLRAFRLETRGVVTYLDQEVDFFTGEPLDTADFINSTGESKGVGPLVGLALDQRLGARFTLGASIALAVPSGEIEGLSTETVTLDHDGPRGLPPDLVGTTLVEHPSSNEHFEQVETRVGLEVRLGAGFTALLGYTSERWSDVALRPRVVAGSLELEEVDAGFDGLSAGLRYEF